MNIAAVCGFFLCLLLSVPALASGRKFYDHAIALEKAGYMDGAIESINTALKQEPQNDLYFATAAHLEFNRGKFLKAYTHALRALQIKQVGWYNIIAARSAFALGKFSESRKYAQQALSFGTGVLGNANVTTAQEIAHQAEPYSITLLWQIPAQRLIQKNGSYLVTVAVPPADMGYQKTDIEARNARVMRDYTQNGNRLLDLISESGKSVELTMRIERHPLSQALDFSKSSTKKFPDEVKLYLGPSHKVDLDSVLLKAIAASVKGRTHLETIQNILRWMNENLKYTVSDFLQSSEVVERGYGDCWGWSSVFTALARLNGIPARNVWGMANYPGFAPEGHLKGHTWAEFYSAEAGWVQVEPQYPGLLGTLPSHYLRVAHSTATEGWDAVMSLPDITLVISKRHFTGAQD